MSLLIDNRPAVVPLIKACDALTINRSTVYWRRSRRDLSEQKKQANRSRKHCQQSRALAPQEHNRLLTLFNSDEFIDQPPMEIYHTLLERGQQFPANSDCKVNACSTFLRTSSAETDSGRYYSL